MPKTLKMRKPLDSLNSQIIKRGYIVVCAMLLGLMFAFIPYECDDFVYGAKFKDLFHDGLQFKEFKEFFLWHYENLNGRFGDKLMPLLLFIPKWTYAIITSVLIIIMFRCAEKFIASGHGEASTLQIIILVSLLTLFLPWSENMFTVAYSFNYIWLIALTLVLLQAFFNPPQKLWHRTAVYGISMFVSSSHELFCLAVGFAMVSYLLLNFRKIRRFHVWLMIAWAIGGLFIYGSMGFRRRFFTVVDVYDGEINSLLYLLVNPEISILMLMFATSLIVSLIFNRFRKQLNKERISKLLFICIVIAINLAIASCSFRDARVYFCANIFSAIGFVYIISIWNFELKQMAKFTIGGILSLFVILHLFVSVYWQTKIFRQYNDIVDIWLQTHDEVIYYDLHFINDIPLITLSKPNSIEFQTGFYRIEFVDFYGGNPKEEKLSVLPLAFRDFDFNETTKVSEKSNIYLYNEYILSDEPLRNKYKNRDNEHMSLTVKFADGSEEDEVQGFYQPFTDGKTGRELYFWQPVFSSRQSYSKQILSIEKN